MRGVAYALFGFGMLLFGALTSVPASASCYRNCESGYRSGPIHRHRPAIVRYERYEHYERRPAHHDVRHAGCCGGSRHFLRSDFEGPRYHSAIHRPRYHVTDEQPVDGDEDVSYSRPSHGFGTHSSGCCGAYHGSCCGGGYHGYHHHSHYRPYHSGYGLPYPNGYYISGFGGYGGDYRGLVYRGGFHRFGGFGHHGYVRFRHAGFGHFYR